MEFLRAGSNVMQTFTFSASEDNMGSKVTVILVGVEVEAGREDLRVGWVLGIYDKTNLLTAGYETDLMCSYSLLKTLHKMSIRKLIIM